MELTPPTLFRHMGFIYPYKERVKVIPFSEVGKTVVEKLQPFAEHLVDGWLSKEGKASFTEEFLRQVEVALWSALDAVIGALGGLDSIEIKRERLKP